MECGIVPAIGAEVEVKTIKPKRGKRKGVPGKENRDTKKKSKRCLNQSEKRAISDTVLHIDKADLLSSVLQHMDDEAHIKAFSCRSEFWDSLKISDLLPSICESLNQATYMACSKGKDKQMQFILQWYQQCRKMLLEEKSAHGLSDTTSKWIDFRNGCQPQCPLFHSNSVMICSCTRCSV